MTITKISYIADGHEFGTNFGDAAVSIAIAPGGNTNYVFGWCFLHPTTHDVYTSFSGTDSNGKPVSGNILTGNGNDVTLVASGS